uniref:Uncharacterized protein n=1 Tax=uncultured bacterium contig00109 TaxID=1181574 RepID=A0A806K2F5_9BACT|nr:hypothetical protein [uncultured bacterium contig00109]
MTPEQEQTIIDAKREQPDLEEDPVSQARAVVDPNLGQNVDIMD